MNIRNIRLQQFTCAACGKTSTYRFDADTGKSLDAASQNWSTIGVTPQTPNGRIDKTALVYACSATCTQRANEEPYTPIMREAREWVEPDAEKKVH